MLNSFMNSCHSWFLIYSNTKLIDVSTLHLFLYDWSSSIKHILLSFIILIIYSGMINKSIRSYISHPLYPCKSTICNNNGEPKVHIAYRNKMGLLLIIIYQRWWCINIFIAICSSDILCMWCINIFLILIIISY